MKCLAVLFLMLAAGVHAQEMGTVEGPVDREMDPQYYRVAHNRYRGYRPYPYTHAGGVGIGVGAGGFESDGGIFGRYHCGRKCRTCLRRCNRFSEGPQCYKKCRYGFPYSNVYTNDGNYGHYVG